MLPMDEVGGRAQAPLMSSKPAECAVMPFVEEPIEIVFTIVGKGDAVAHEVDTAHRREVLHGGWLPCRVVTDAAFTPAEGRRSNKSRERMVFFKIPLY